MLQSFFGRQFTMDTRQVAPHGAANAAVIHLDDLLIMVLHQQLAVNAGFAKFILNDRNPVPMGLLEDVVEQRGFATTQKAGEDGDGDWVHERVFLSFLAASRRFVWVR